MSGTIDSLNLSNAVAITCYEILRQNSTNKKPPRFHEAVLINFLIIFTASSTLAAPSFTFAAASFTVRLLHQQKHLYSVFYFSLAAESTTAAAESTVTAAESTIAVCS